jgi:hypothetical protein
MSVTHNSDSDVTLLLLARLTDQLAASDLTASEASALRPKLLDLLDELAGVNASGGTHFADPKFSGELTIAGCADRCAVV